MEDRPEQHQTRKTVELHYSDVQAEDSDYDFEISLSKLIMKPVKDVYGYISGEFGGATFKMTRIIFEDGTSLGCEGEHDFPYLVEYRLEPQPNFDDETMFRIMKEDEERYEHTD